MSIDKDFQFTKKSVDSRMHAPKIVKAQKTYENNGACEACGAVITKGSYVLTANEVSGSKWSHDIRTVKTHRLCASCTAEYIKATSGVSVEEPKTYAQKQAEWIKENNVKEGTKVRVTRTFTEDEDGSCCWEHDDLVGKTGIIGNISPINLGINMDDRKFRVVPYFALEVIKEPTYRSYNNDELNSLVGKVLTQKGCGYPCLVTQRYSMTQVCVNGYLYNAEQLLELFTLYGEPCGVKES